MVPARARARLVLPVPARHGSAVHDQGPGLVRVVCGRHEARPAPNDSAGSARARSRRRWAGAAPISSAWLSAGGRPVVRGVRG